MIPKIGTKDFESLRSETEDVAWFDEKFHRFQWKYLSYSGFLLGRCLGSASGRVYMNSAGCNE